MFSEIICSYLKWQYAYGLVNAQDKSSNRTKYYQRADTYLVVQLVLVLRPSRVHRVDLRYHEVPVVRDFPRVRFRLAGPVDRAVLVVLVRLVSPALLH